MTVDCEHPFSPAFVLTSTLPKDCVRTSLAKTKKKTSSSLRTCSLLRIDQAEAQLTIDAHRLKFTNLNKIYYPKDGICKRDLLNYYDAVAPLILPHLKDRPLSLKRYPNGIDADFFFQKEVRRKLPQMAAYRDGGRHPPRDRRRSGDPAVFWSTWAASITTLG